MNTITIGIRGNSCKAHSFECKTQMYIAIKIMEEEIWVRMRNIPRSFDIRNHIVPAMTEQALAAKGTAVPTGERKPLFIIEFLWYLYLPIIIYVKSISIL